MANSRVSLRQLLECSEGNANNIDKNNIENNNIDNNECTYVCMSAQGKIKKIALKGFKKVNCG